MMASIPLDLDAMEIELVNLGPINRDDVFALIERLRLAEVCAELLTTHEHDGTGYCSPDNNTAEGDAAALDAWRSSRELS